jgi:hypothetical protein
MLNLCVPNDMCNTIESLFDGLHLVFSTSPIRLLKVFFFFCLVLTFSFWFLVFGFWFLVLGFRFSVFGFRF